jgi:hypothetical protein
MPQPLGQLGKLLAVIGAVLLLAGLLLTLAPKIPFLGRLPGDFHWKIGGTRVFVPLATSVILSILLTLLLNLVFRLFK